MPSEEIMEQASDLIVGGLSLAGFIILAVQAIKVSGLIGEEHVAKVPWAVAGAFLVLKAVEAAYPPSAPIIAGVLQAFAGAVAAVLSYFYGLKPVARAIGSGLSSSDLE